MSPIRTAASAKMNSSHDAAAAAYQRGPHRPVSAHTHTRQSANSSISPTCCWCSAPVQCVLDKDSLADGLRVLIPMDDQLLYAGHVNTVHSPDM